MITEAAKGSSMEGLSQCFSLISCNALNGMIKYFEIVICKKCMNMPDPQGHMNPLASHHTPQ